MQNGMGKVCVILQDERHQSWHEFVKCWNEQGYINVPQSVKYIITKDKAYIQQGEQRTTWCVEYTSERNSFSSYEPIESAKSISLFKYIP